MEPLTSQSSRSRKMRSPDFSSEEISIIISYHLQHSHVLSSKHSNEIMQRKKKEIYDKLVRDVNSISSHHRSLQSIKDKWQNIQRDWRCRSGHFVLPFSIGGIATPVTSENEQSDNGTCDNDANAADADLGEKGDEWKAEKSEIWSGPTQSSIVDTLSLHIKTETNSHKVSFSANASDTLDLPHLSDNETHEDSVTHSEPINALELSSKVSQVSCSPQGFKASSHCRKRKLPVIDFAYRREKLRLLRRRTKAFEAMAMSQRQYFDVKKVYMELLIAQLKNSIKKSVIFPNAVLESISSDEEESKRISETPG